MRHRRYQRGFTLVELLVVLAIIGILVALLLPAVQAAREAARMVTCKNNLRQVSLAVLNYESMEGELPSIIDRKVQTAPIERLIRENRKEDSLRSFGWRYTILPFLEEQTLHDQIDARHTHVEWTGSDTPASSAKKPALVAPYQCPSTPGTPIPLPFRVVLDDVKDQTTRSNQTVFDAIGARHYAAPISLRFEGMCAWQSKMRENLTTGARDSNHDEDYSVMLTPAKLRYVTDGLSKTILLVEESSSYDLEGNFWGHQFTSIHADQEGLSPPFFQRRRGMFSHHNSGAQVGLCDGSVRFLPENTPHDEVARLLHRSDGGVTPQLSRRSP